MFGSFLISEKKLDVRTIELGQAVSHLIQGDYLFADRF